MPTRTSRVDTPRLTATRPAAPDDAYATDLVRAAAPAFPFLAPPVEADELGRLGNYRVLEVLGKGGMAFVFRAEDVALRRQVALKVVRPDLDRDMDAWQRFLREARIMAAIQHEHLVSVYQVGQDARAIYLAMELLHGETLEQWGRRIGPAPAADLVRLGRQVATGLEVIHRHGLVHRDLKPGNLWLEAPAGRVKILDFGLARAEDDDGRSTQPGMIVGTPAFMSPEQARGERVDARSDLFSLGAVLYALATNRLPFDAANTMGILSALATAEPPPIEQANAALPRPLVRLILQLLAKDPAARPASAAAVIERLAQLEARPAEAAVPVAAPAPRRRPGGSKGRHRKPAARRRWLMWACVLGAAVALAAVAVAAVVGTVAVALLTPAAGPAGAVVHLDTLTPAEAVNWIQGPPPPPPHEFKGMPPPPPPGPFVVRVRGVPSPHGLFMHGVPGPQGGATRVGYRLEGKFRTFQTEVSLNDGPPRSDTPLTFTVLGDGKLLWQSRPVHSQADAQTCRVSLDGVRMLTLQVDCPGEPRGAHAVWLEPRLER